MSHSATIGPRSKLVGQPIRAPDGVDKLRAPPLLPATHAAETQPIHVLICMENAGVCELIGLLLADAGCMATSMDVTAWLIGDPIPGPSPEVLILDAWPLRYANAATQAHIRLAAQPAALVLLLDNQQPTQFADQFSAITTIPMLFTLENLVTAVQQGSQALGVYRS